MAQTRTVSREDFAIKVIELLRMHGLENRERVRRFADLIGTEHRAFDDIKSAAATKVRGVIRDSTGVDDLGALIRGDVTIQMPQGGGYGKKTADTLQEILDYLRESIDLGAMELKSKGEQTRIGSTTIITNPNGKVTISQTFEISQITDPEVLEMLILDVSDRRVRSQALDRLKELIRK